MSVTKTISERWLLERGQGNVNLASDTFRAVLMESGFAFNPENHGEWADVSGSELADGNGYTTGGQTLITDSSWAVSDGTASISWEDLEWVADGGTMATFDGVLIYDDTHGDDVIVGYIDLGESVSLAEGMTFKAMDLGYDSKQEA